MGNSLGKRKKLVLPKMDFKSCSRCSFPELGKLCARPELRSAELLPVSSFRPILKGRLLVTPDSKHIFNMQDRTCVILLHKGSKRFRWFAKSANTPEPQRVIATICCAVICRIHG